MAKLLGFLKQSVGIESVLRCTVIWIQAGSLVLLILVSSPDLIRRIYRFQYNAGYWKRSTLGLVLGLGPRLLTYLNFEILPLAQVPWQCLHSPSSCNGTLFSRCSSLTLVNYSKPLSLCLSTLCLKQLYMWSCASPYHLNRVLGYYSCTLHILPYSNLRYCQSSP